MGYIGSIYGIMEKNRVTTNLSPGTLVSFAFLGVPEKLLGGLEFGILGHVDIEPGIGAGPAVVVPG